MQSLNLNVAGMIAVGLVLVGCSSAYQSGRANLERSRQYKDALAYSQGPISTRATINYRDNSISARLPPQRGSRPGPTSRPLRRFAAMPRHKPHASHVRQHEGACLRSGIVQPTRFVRPRSPIGGGSCYISKPFRMFAAAQGRVRFQPAATMRCQMVPSVETWVRDVLRPAARRYLGSDVVRLRIAASYACRSRNSKAGARLSEHGKANAIDISTFFSRTGEWLRSSMVGAATRVSAASCAMYTAGPVSISPPCSARMLIVTTTITSTSISRDTDGTALIASASRQQLRFCRQGLVPVSRLNSVLERCWREEKSSDRSCLHSAFG